MIKIFKDKSTKLNFKLNIVGSASTPTVKLVLPTSESLSTTITAMVEGDSAKVVVPPLIEFGDSFKIYDMALLEVIVDGNYFTPWKGSVEIAESIKISASLVQEANEEIQDQTITVDATVEKENKELKLEDLNVECFQERFDEFLKDIDSKVDEQCTSPQKNFKNVKIDKRKSLSELIKYVLEQ